MREFFKPRAVAVVGASRREGKAGHSILLNLLRGGFPGAIYPINPGTPDILGVKAYPDVCAIPATIDLALLVIPAAQIQAALEACAGKGARAAVVISAGFKEIGGEGAALERALRRRARELGIRVLGPNCLGVISTQGRLNASFSPGMPPEGGIGFFSQSGALGTAILDWAVGRQIGLSKFVSLGNKMDLSEVEAVQALSEDPDTSVILGYVEGIERGREFMEAALAASRKKPLIMYKAGTTSAGARAASSHTGALVGSDKAVEAALRQSGVFRVHSLEDLFDLAQAFSSQPLPSGPRLLILTNAGGPGIIAADAVEKARAELAQLCDETVTRLRRILPPTAALYNPVDVIGDARADRYQKALEVLLPDPGVDGVLVLLTPQAMTEVDKTAEFVGRAAASAGKPVLTSFMGEASMGKAREILRGYHVPDYPYPEGAVRAFEALAVYRSWRDSPGEQPVLFPCRAQEAGKRIRKARAQGRIDLGESEARFIAEAFGFRFPCSVVAQTAEEAVNAAEEAGYPVVLKIVSAEILHKTDVGGVKVGLRGPKEVREGFLEITTRVRRLFPDAPIQGVMVQEMVTGGKEVILGMSRDPQFGPLLMFGLGGIYVEVLKDVTFRVAPITARDAEEMIREIRSFPLLLGVRGEKPADLEALVEGLQRLSQLAMELPEVLEMDINPLMVRPAGEGAVAVDVRMSLVHEEAP